MKRRLTPLLCAILLLAPNAARSRPRRPFALEAQREALLLGTGSALGIAALVLEVQVQPLTPQEIDGLDLSDVNRFDRAGVAAYRDDPAGDGLLAASYAIPLALFVAADCRRDWQVLTLMWAETTLLNMSAAGVVKGSVRRTRPYAYDPQAPAHVKTTKSARLSFYSGHTSQAAANCFFAARVFSAYVTGTKAKVLVWTGAALYPAVAGTFRVRTGQHFRTDVMTGYCAGALIGFLVPELHKVRGLRTVRPESVGGGMGLGLRLSFQ